jgi:hypothetical protein
VFFFTVTLADRSSHLLVRERSTVSAAPIGNIALRLPGTVCGNGREFLILLRLCAAGYPPGNREKAMASFVVLKSGGADVLVNVENVNFIKSHGQTSTVHFTGGQDLVINVSTDEAFGMMQDAKQTPAKR